ncbi:hypothetical protein GGS23DRAFT_555258 [Durotheca rogersii]|uniref:uncharacterized protein n=1 Tax=Durotheca rogersii TaxID=419775 RepID=UPI00221F510D|nr:uncharacterized protein GGS23DRAFT_555258 [Durotheca rogersii]KAI5866052.1 hypothetical protein GGS23DRAFT_555258 [Durotheca rogersii]
MHARVVYVGVFTGPDDRNQPSHRITAPSRMTFAVVRAGLFFFSFFFSGECLSFFFLILVPGIARYVRQVGSAGEGDGSAARQAFGRLYHTSNIGRDDYLCLSWSTHPRPGRPSSSRVPLRFLISLSLALSRPSRFLPDMPMHTRYVGTSVCTHVQNPSEPAVPGPVATRSRRRLFACHPPDRRPFPRSAPYRSAGLS